MDYPREKKLRLAIKEVALAHQEKCGGKGDTLFCAHSAQTHRVTQITKSQI